MELKQNSLSVLQETIRKAIRKFSNSCDATVVTDIHLQANPVNGQLVIFDDDDKELGKCSIKEWENCEGEFYEEVEQELREILGKMKEEKEFDSLPILKPYSFVLIDDEKETITELLIIDDDTLIISDELLKGLDEELDEFIKNLLEN